MKEELNFVHSVLRVENQGPEDMGRKILIQYKELLCKTEQLSSGDILERF